MQPQFVGWAAGFVLLLTIATQVIQQWRSRSNDGVTPWLFVGQVTASTGFLVYSILQADPVFIATNALLMLSAMTGLAVMWRNGRNARRSTRARAVRSSASTM